MVKIYAGYICQVLFDLCVMAAFLYAVGWAILGPDVSRIVTDIGKEILIHG